VLTELVIDYFREIEKLIRSGVLGGNIDDTRTKLRTLHGRLEVTGLLTLLLERRSSFLSLFDSVRNGTCAVFLGDNQYTGDI
jgi:hypothetical protein